MMVVEEEARPEENVVGGGAKGVGVGVGVGVQGVSGRQARPLGGPVGDSAG